MRRALGLITAVIVASWLAPAFAEAPGLPAGAKRLTSKDDIVAALTDGPHKIAIYANNGKVFNVQSTFDWKTKTIRVEGEKNVFKWDVKDGKYCVLKEPCRTIYSDGGKLYEVDPDGKVHAVHG
jgi:hypothetical protein